MADALIEYMRPGFPKQSVSASGYSAIIEYIGTEAQLYTAVELGEPWPPYRGKVEDVQGDPIEGTDKVIMTVKVTGKFGDEDSPGDAPGEELATTYEIDWVNVQKQLIAHPVFSENADTKLSDNDIFELEKWEEMTRLDFKQTFQFYRLDISKLTDEDLNNLSPNDDNMGTLSDNAQRYARGVLRGIEEYIAKAPVVRMSTIYKNGVPPTGEKVGEQDTPVGIPGLPVGYQWVKEADRSTNTGKQNEWRRDQEWLGAEEVLIDSKNIYF